MAGQPQFNALKTKLKELGGISYICEQIRDGATLKKIAESLGVRRQSMYKYIHLSEENEKAYRNARRDGTDAIVEDAMRILDDSVDLDSAGVSAAKNRADMRKWYASVTNRDAYGPPQQAAATINIDLGLAHLEALRAHGGPALPPAEIPEAECEVIA